MKYMFLPVMLAAFGASALDFEGTDLSPVEVHPEASTGLNSIYVLSDTRGASMVYTASSATSEVKWSRYSRLGAAYSEEVSPSRNGSRLTLPCSDGDMGYVIEENGRSQYFWIIDYSDHALDMQSVAFAPEQDCDRTHFVFTGSAAELDAYSPLGRHIAVSRDIEVIYNTLTFDEESFSYRQTTTTETLGGIGSTFSVMAPLTNTSFTIEGDRFLKAWNRTQSLETETFDTPSVDARTRATQAERNADNEQKVESDGLGGSAPADITFEAAVSDGAIFNEWQISRSADFSDVLNSYNELEFSYTFTEQGTTYVRFTANNAAGTCPYESDTYQVFIGESKLDIPNAFSPDGSPDVNDVWKVSYKSIVTYKCTIFNRWGKKLFETTDPSAGWDGKVGGKTVPAGVYFYVIKAVGADGVKYDRAGDINIIGYKDNRTQNNPDIEE